MRSCEYNLSDACRHVPNAHIVRGVRYALAERLKTLCRYREFIGEETKRIWEWQCRHEAEEAFWTSVVNGAVGEATSISTSACLLSLTKTSRKLSCKHTFAAFLASVLKLFLSR